MYFTVYETNVILYYYCTLGPGQYFHRSPGRISYLNICGMFLSHQIRGDMLHMYTELKLTIQIPNVRLNIFLFTSYLLSFSYL